MRCCPDCFTDELMRDLAEADGKESNGICDLCGVMHEVLYVLKPEGELAYQFEKMLDVFAPVSVVKEKAKIHEQGSLYKMFTSLWDVFHDISQEKFYQFIRTLFPSDGRIENMIVSDVMLAPERGTRSIDDFAIFGEQSWDVFSENIKHKLRYCARMEHKDILFNLLNSLELIINCNGPSWYRARIWNNKKTHPVFGDLCEPHCNKAGEGRMSPKGVSCLYIASSAVTAMAEIRAAIHDEVAVMEMKPRKSLRILDLSSIDKISPCLPDVNCAELAANIEDLKRIKEELIRPMRATDDPVEYVPTQFIADCAKSLKFDGIGYRSIMQSAESEPGYNIACFLSAKECFEEQSINLYKIKSIEYATSKI